MKKHIIIAAAMLAAMSCGRSEGGFSRQELAVIESADSIMRVLTIEDSADLMTLRAVSRDFSAEALLSKDFARLSELMVATVTHPSQDGVGIAAPQVGLNRRVVAVQRFDKEGEPFEVYPNIRIVCLSDSVAYGPEGCLSVPDMRADVLRSQEVVIEYTDMNRLKELASGLSPRKLRRHLQREYGAGRSYGEGVGRVAGWRSGGEAGRVAGWRSSGAHLPTVRDTISGFTAVIFQHETDHLDGILYIDRL